ncbi:hypothetical protein NPIL_319321 [Nephila pilipes]|uniref:Uncharacterized protein n=1 Tax=Nephila pilipes TaxID=299642 RepID=A0A8X6N2E2_NEPPI|nr:hypothetical protein NPIL_319321 [Nephila pilipes]
MKLVPQSLNISFRVPRQAIKRFSAAMHVRALRSLTSSEWITFIMKHTNAETCILIALTPLTLRGVIKNDHEKPIPPLRNALPEFTLAAGKSALICFED